MNIRYKIQDLIYSISSQPKQTSNPIKMKLGAISVILNVYKRQNMLEKQIEAVLNQSVPIHAEDIHVWYNGDGPDPQYSRINTYKCNYNTTAYGRFIPLLLCNTEYVAVFDDDTIPRVDWFKSCLETMDDVNGILGCTGVIVPRAGDKNPYYKVGWNGVHNEKTKRVDYVGHSWFFRQEWAKYMWYEQPVTWETGMDMWFSYQAQKYGGINTFVPPHPDGDKDIWGATTDISMKIGRDRNASWRRSGWTAKRHNLHWYCIRNGWNTVKQLLDGIKDV